MRVYLVLLVAVLVNGGAWAGLQERRPGEKPVLIRDDVTRRADQVEEALPHDPEQARKSVEIGDFYIKRDNPAAAEQRYREAIEYNRAWPEPYRKLVHLLERLERAEDAVEICRRFLAANPDSKLAGEFDRILQRLESPDAP